MDFEEKKEKVRDSLIIQAGFYNHKKAGEKDMDFQFVMNEPEGEITFYLEIKNKKCKLVEGRSKKPICEIITDLEMWEDLGGEYISPKDAMKSGRFKLKGNVLAFILNYNKIFSGTTEKHLEYESFTSPTDIDKIRNVLIISCSPRGKKGATQYFAEILSNGMERAGATVETILLSNLKINPCLGCFYCCSSTDKKCIHDGKDDMNIFWDKYFEADLIVWATPIYVFHGTTKLKQFIDRFFVLVEPYFVLDAKKTLTHPRRKKHLPYEAILSCSGFTSLKMFKPLIDTIKMWTKHTNSKILTELRRTTSMMFIGGDIRHKKMDQSIIALEQAGYELIKLKKVKNKTKKVFEQQIFSKAKIMSATNTRLDQIVAGERKMNERVL